ncbi:hypothetical protein [Streptomyces sp. NPDC007369]|uniref:hypothetical protein n=1 Tax=Streptomyces sp. NPDC007369 TaxID=3154589 RepID=UPI0033F7E84C
MRGLAALVLAGAGVAGCSAESEAAGPLGKTADAVAKAGAAEVSVRVTSPRTGGRPVEIKGAYSWANGYAMEARMPAGSALEEAGKGGTAAVRLVQDSYFYETEDDPEGKRWLKVKAAEVREASDAEALGGPENAVSAITALTAAKDVAKVGEQDVNGRSATHYKATIPLGKLHQDAERPWHGVVPNGVDMLAEVWVDGKGVPVRLSQTAGATTVVTDFLSFAVPIVVSAPPAGETAERGA